MTKGAGLKRKKTTILLEGTQEIPPQNNKPPETLNSSPSFRENYFKIVDKLYFKLDSLYQYTISKVKEKTVELLNIIKTIIIFLIFYISELIQLFIGIFIITCSVAYLLSCLSTIYGPLQQSERSDDKNQHPEEYGKEIFTDESLGNENPQNEKDYNGPFDEVVEQVLVGDFKNIMKIIILPINFYGTKILKETKKIITIQQKNVCTTINKIFSEKDERICPTLDNSNKTSTDDYEELDGDI
jgi:hypothetical protein